MLHPFRMPLNKRSISGSYINFSRIYRMFEINMKEIIGVVFNRILSMRNFVLIQMYFVLKRKTQNTKNIANEFDVVT